jgi:hypothetical protein
MNIGLIGAQNSHAKHFCEAINRDQASPGICIAYVYGPDAPDEAAALCENFRLMACYSDDDLIRKSDAVAVTYRKGSLHYEPVMKALRAGKPVFNDKPFAGSLKEAKKITEYAQSHGVLLSGGSSLKSLDDLPGIAAEVKSGSAVVVTFAADPKNEYDGYWFYGIHSAEVALALCGTEFQTVKAMRNGSSVVSMVNYADRQCVLVTGPDFHELKIAVTNGGGTVVHHVMINSPSVCAAEFCRMLRDKTIPRPYRYYVKATELLSRIIEEAGLDG